MGRAWCPMFWMCTLLLWGFAEAAVQGREFVTAFLQNMDSEELPNQGILVTGASQEPSTNVTVMIMKYNLTNTVIVGKGETVKIPIPLDKEFKGTGIFMNSVVVKANADITVMSTNSKKNSGDVALVAPVEQLGTKYIVTSPPEGPKNQYKQFSVTSYKKTTVVDIYLKGSVHFIPKRSVKAKQLEIVLQPYETFQILSKDDLSGTRVVSQHPVVVQAGHTCAKTSRGCNHVYKQLLPIES